MNKGAVIDGPYRYWLSRVWGEGPKRVTWIMLNPSTANAEIDDPTIRKCIGFSKQRGFDGLYVVNMFAWRATDPKDLIAAWKAKNDIIGVRNEHFVDLAVTQSDTVVLAWGSNMENKKLIAAQREMGYHTALEIAHRQWSSSRPDPLRVVTLGLADKSGQPKHPLYIPYDQEFVPFYARGD